MPTDEISVQAHRIRNQGADLYYEVRGEGPPLIMIAGGGGDSWWYIPLAERLSDDYKVILYDLRGNARSPIDQPETFEVSQQSRDTIAILKEVVGDEPVIVFGSSSGAIIALDIAKNHPESVQIVIAHEPPTPRILPEREAKKWQRLFAQVYWIGAQFSIAMAAIRFVMAVGLPIKKMSAGAKEVRVYREHSSEPYVNDTEANEYWIGQQLLPTVNYLPDVRQIRKNGISVVMGAGQASIDKGRFYTKTARILADQLECDFVVFPGDHISYWDEPDNWAKVLREALHKAMH